MTFSCYTLLSLWVVTYLAATVDGNQSNITSEIDSVFEWRTDAVNISSEAVQGIRPWTFSVVAQANGEFFAEKTGHFRLSIMIETEDFGSATGLSECIELSSSVAKMKTSISETVMMSHTGEELKLSAVVSINAKKYGNGKVESSYRTVIDLLFDSSIAYSLSVELDFNDCLPLRTVGHWDDPANWNGGAVPTNLSHVYFPINSGVAIISADVVLKSLNMLGGYIIAQTSGCAYGWSPFMNGSQG